MRSMSGFRGHDWRSERPLSCKTCAAYETPRLSWLGHRFRRFLQTPNSPFPWPRCTDPWYDNWFAQTPTDWQAYLATSLCPWLSHEFKRLHASWDACCYSYDCSLAMSCSKWPCSPLAVSYVQCQSSCPFLGRWSSENWACHLNGRSASMP